MKDKTNAYDLTNQQFSPSVSGQYTIVGIANFGVGADQDTLRVKLQNITDATQVGIVGLAASGTGNHVVPVSISRQLDSSKTYELQVANLNSSDTLSGGAHRTHMLIKREVV